MYKIKKKNACETGSHIVIYNKGTVLLLVIVICIFTRLNRTNDHHTLTTYQLDNGKHIL